MNLCHKNTQTQASENVHVNLDVSKQFREGVFFFKSPSTHKYFMMLPLVVNLCTCFKMIVISFFFHFFKSQPVIYSLFFSS